MKTFTDKHTGKLYTVEGLTVTQSRDGIVTGTSKHNNFASLESWLDMMGFYDAFTSYAVTATKSRNKYARNFLSFVRAISPEAAIERCKFKYHGLIDIQCMTSAEYDAKRKAEKEM